MLKKFLTNLPFNPSMIDDIPKYIARAKKERRIRALSVGVLTVGLLFQIYIYAFPAQPTATSSANDLIRGGFDTKSQAVNDCKTNSEGYRNILAAYDISCSDLASAELAKIGSSPYKDSLYSLNRLPYGKQREEKVSINSQYYYLRPFSESESFGRNGLRVLVGSDFMALLNSGNLVFIGEPSNNVVNCTNKCPVLYLSARDITSNVNNVSGKTVHPGDTLIYTFVTTNYSDSTINSLKVNDNISSLLTYGQVNNLYGGTLNSGELSWPTTSIKPGQTITNNLSLTIDSSLNQSPISSTDPDYYNLTMTTVYGNAVVVKLPYSFAKHVEITTTQQLPEGTAKESLIVTLVIYLISLYFYVRSSLTLRELKRLRSEYRS